MTHQLEALNWMIGLYNQNANGILADQMGLGKTIEVISLFGHLSQSKSNNGPHLVIAPLNVVNNWFKELRKWLPNLRAIVLQATANERDYVVEKYLKPKNFDIIITSYEGFDKSQYQLKKFYWEYLIIDEAHRLKGLKTKLRKDLLDVRKSNTLLLTGTPLQNNLIELWSLFNFLIPNLFYDLDLFLKMFEESSMTTDKNGKQVLDEESVNNEKQKLIKKLHLILRPFMLRRTKSDVELLLPPKKEIYLYVGMSNLQRDVYKNLILYKKPMLETDPTKKPRAYNNILMQLRKAAIHPYLFPGIEDMKSPDFHENLVKMSGKMQMLDKLVHRLYKENHKCLIFSQFTSVLDIIEDYCNLRGWKYSRLDGTCNMEQRQQSINDFIEEDESGNFVTKKFLFLITTRSGGLGQNLVSADTVIIMDSDWNPQVDLQAMDRAHRIGQKNHVNVYRIISKHTLEEKILERALMKLKFDYLLVHKGRNVSIEQEESEKMMGQFEINDKKLSKEDIEELSHYGANEIFNMKQEDLKDEDQDELLQRGENLAIEKEKLINEKIARYTNLKNCDFNTNNHHIKAFDYDFSLEEKKLNEEACKNQRLKEKQKSNKNLAVTGIFNNQYNSDNVDTKNIFNSSKKSALMVLDEYDKKKRQHQSSGQAVVLSKQTIEQISDCIKKSTAFEYWHLQENVDRIYEQLKLEIQRYDISGDLVINERFIHNRVEKWLNVIAQVGNYYDIKYKQDVDQANGRETKNVEHNQMLFQDKKFREGRVELQDTVLTDEQQKELSGLLRSGFGYWRYQKGFAKYRNLIEKYGRKQLQLVAGEMSRSFEEICTYTELYFQKIDEFEKSNRKDEKPGVKLDKVKKVELKYSQNLVINKLLNDYIRFYGENWWNIDLANFSHNDNVLGAKKDIVVNLKGGSTHSDSEDVDKQFILYCYGKNKTKFDDYKVGKSNQDLHNIIREYAMKQRNLNFTRFLMEYNTKRIIDIKTELIAQCLKTTNTFYPTQINDIDDSGSVSVIATPKYSVQSVCVVSRPGSIAVKPDQAGDLVRKPDIIHTHSDDNVGMSNGISSSSLRWQTVSSNKEKIDGFCPEKEMIDPTQNKYCEELIAETYSDNESEGGNNNDNGCGKDNRLYKIPKNINNLSLMQIKNNFQTKGHQYEPYGKLKDVGYSRIGLIVNRPSKRLDCGDGGLRGMDL